MSFLLDVITLNAMVCGLQTVIRAEDQKRVWSYKALKEHFLPLSPLSLFSVSGPSAAVGARASALFASHKECSFPSSLRSCRASCTSCKGSFPTFQGGFLAVFGLVSKQSSSGGSCVSQERIHSLVQGEAVREPVEATGEAGKPSLRGKKVPWQLPREQGSCT